MPRNDRQAQRFFVGGEQSPYLEARTDLARWQASLRECTNFIVVMQGAVTRRSGFADVYAAQNNSRLIPFGFGAGDGYAIEFSPTKCRFFRDYGILMNGAAVYEINCPFSADEIAVLSRAQSADVLYLATGTQPIQQLSRVAQINWVFASMAYKNGPFMDPNLDEDFTLSTTTNADILKGAQFTLIASKPLFNAGHVGALWLIKERDGGQYPKWVNDKRCFGVGDHCRWEGNTYLCTVNGGDWTGSTPPTHLVGEEWDGTPTGEGSGKKWKYLHSGWGVVKITGYTDATHVTVVAQTFIPAQLSTGSGGGGGTWRWAEGAWSEYRGYPSLVCLHKGRLYAISSKSLPMRVWASCIDDYSNFDAQTIDDQHGFSFDIEDDSGSGEVNIPQWVVSGKKLVIGTAGGEFVVGSSDVTSPIAVDSVDAAMATNEGSASAPAVKAGDPLFISKDGKRVHGLAYDFNQDDYIAPDLTIEADHIAGGGATMLQEIAWQRDPFRIVWARRSDGQLVAMTYRRDQNISAWHQHPTPKGAVKSLCICPSPTAVRQDLWTITERTLAGGTVRRIECLMPFFERGDFDVKDAFFVDGGKSQAFANPVTELSGFPAAYIGETLAVLADGQVRPPCVVAAAVNGTGKITLDRPAQVVTAGLAFTSRMETLPYDRDVIGGKLMGRATRVSHLVIDMIRSFGLTVQSGNRDSELVKPTGDADVDAAAPLYTGPSADIGVDSGWDDGGTVVVSTGAPLPATIRAISPNNQVAG